MNSDRSNATDMMEIRRYKIQTFSISKLYDSFSTYSLLYPVDDCGIWYVVTVMTLHSPEDSEVNFFLEFTKARVTQHPDADLGHHK